MAEGYLRYFAQGKADVYSAGVETHGVNPNAIAIMQEDGIDISHHTSNNVSEYQNIDFDFVITVCDNAKNAVPFFQAKPRSFITTSPTLPKQRVQKKKLKQSLEE